MEFPARLRQLRKKNNMTQEELGKKINVTKVSVSGYETGNRNPDMDTLQKIADVFGVSIDFLLGRTISENDSSIKPTDDDIPDVDRIAAHMESEYGEYDPEMARFLKRIIRETIDEYDRKKKQDEQKD